jgi:hypothetical protein
MSREIRINLEKNQYFFRDFLPHGGIPHPRDKTASGRIAAGGRIVTGNLFF